MSFLNLYRAYFNRIQARPKMIETFQIAYLIDKLDETIQGKKLLFHCMLWTQKTSHINFET